ncbi:MAG: ABC transporter permease subunit [Candidatus Pelethousia sp.]|nr:ABC transporter permease subunit [Candidatus Pelethousia sp.]
MKTAKYLIRPILIACAWLLIWEIAAVAVGQEVKLPAPWRVWEALLSLAGQGAFWLSLGATLGRVLAAFLLGMLAGGILGTLCAFVPWFDALLSPLRSVIKATPITSFIVLVLLWLSNSMVPLFIAFLMVVPVIWANMQQALGAVSRQLLEMADVFHLSRRDKILHIYLPSIRPQCLAAGTTALGFAWKSAAAAEVLARPEFSIGRGIMESKIYLETPELFAWTVAIILLSMGLEWLMLRLLRWKEAVP